MLSVICDWMDAKMLSVVFDWMDADMLSVVCDWMDANMLSVVCGTRATARWQQGCGQLEGLLLRGECEPSKSYILQLAADKEQISLTDRSKSPELLQCPPHHARLTAWEHHCPYCLLNVSCH